MSKIKLVTDIDKLHRVSRPYEVSEKNSRIIARDRLLAAFEDREGKVQGLAAIQLDIPECAILLRYTKGGKPIVVFNPKVVGTVGKVKSEERCESEMDYIYRVFRPKFAKVEYMTLDGEIVKETLDYKKARIFCHETDHCNGILLQDHGKLIGRAKDANVNN